MIKVTTNSRLVSFQIQKSLKAKSKGIDKAIDNTLRSIQRDVKSNISNNNSPEKDRMIEAVDLDLRNNLVGINNVKAPFAPFIEFGTKSKFTLQDPKLAGISSRFKGIPMDFNELVQRIERSTGLSKDAAVGVARTYARQGTTARPFFYPAVFQNKIVLKRELKRALRKRV